MLWKGSLWKSKDAFLVQVQSQDEAIIPSPNRSLLSSHLQLKPRLFTTASCPGSVCLGDLLPTPCPLNPYPACRTASSGSWTVCCATAPYLCQLLDCSWLPLLMWTTLLTCWPRYLLSIYSMPHQQA